MSDSMNSKVDKYYNLILEKIANSGQDAASRNLLHQEIINFLIASDNFKEIRINLLAAVQPFESPDELTQAIENGTYMKKPEQVIPREGLSSIFRFAEDPDDAAMNELLERAEAQAKTKNGYHPKATVTAVSTPQTPEQPKEPQPSTTKRRGNVLAAPPPSRPLEPQNSKTLAREKVDGKPNLERAKTPIAPSSVQKTNPPPLRTDKKQPPSPPTTVTPPAASTPAAAAHELEALDRFSKGPDKTEPQTLQLGPGKLEQPIVKPQEKKLSKAPLSVRSTDKPVTQQPTVVSSVPAVQLPEQSKVTFPQVSTDLKRSLKLPEKKRAVQLTAFEVAQQQILESEKALNKLLGTRIILLGDWCNAQLPKVSRENPAELTKLNEALLLLNENQYQPKLENYLESLNSLIDAFQKVESFVIKDKTLSTAIKNVIQQAKQIQTEAIGVVTSFETSKMQLPNPSQQPKEEQPIISQIPPATERALEIVSPSQTSTPHAVEISKTLDRNQSIKVQNDEAEANFKILDTHLDQIFKYDKTRPTSTTYKALQFMSLNKGKTRHAQVNSLTKIIMELRRLTMIRDFRIDEKTKFPLLTHLTYEKIIAAIEDINKIKDQIVKSEGKNTKSQLKELCETIVNELNSNLKVDSKSLEDTKPKTGKKEAPG